MTLQEFLHTLGLTQNKWQWTESKDGYIRAIADNGIVMCPLTAVEAFVYGGAARREDQYDAAAERLGIDIEEAGDLAWAADRATSYKHTNMALRLALRQACGLIKPIPPEP